MQPASPASLCHKFSYAAQDPASRLMPEHRRAVSKLKEAFDNGCEWVTLADLASRPVLPTNYSAFCAEPLSNKAIPRGRGWAWNQSNKSTTHYLDGVELKLVKLSPRWKKSSKHRRGKRLSRSDGYREARAPQLKVWVITIFMKTVSYFIWVERGPGDEDTVMTEATDSPTTARRARSDEPSPFAAVPPQSSVLVRGFKSLPPDLPPWQPDEVLTPQSIAFLGEWMPENMIITDWERKL